MINFKKCFILRNHILHDIGNIWFIHYQIEYYDIYYILDYYYICIVYL